MLNDPVVAFQLAMLNRVWGKYAGSVVGSDDPEKSGRLQIMCPAILGNAVVWARPCVPYAGKGVGFFMLPPEKANVWIEFEAGDTTRPIWTGCFWGSGELPDEATSADIKLIATETASIRIDDSAGSVEIANQSEAVTSWTSNVESTAGGASHKVSAAGVVSESAAATGKVDVSDGGVAVNGGAFKVSAG